MKTSTFLLFSAIVLLAQPVQAACSRADLAGSWTVMSDPAICPALALAANGTGSSTCTDSDGSSAPRLTVTLSITAACKVTGTASFGGTRYTVTGRAEQVTGKAKPNTMTLRAYRSGDQGAVIAFRN